MIIEIVFSQVFCGDLGLSRLSPGPPGAEAGLAGGEQAAGEPGQLRARAPAGLPGPAPGPGPPPRGAPGRPLRQGAGVHHRLGQAGAGLHRSHSQ